MYVFNCKNELLVIVSTNVCVTGCTLSEDELRKQIIEHVRHDVGPVAAFKRVIFVPYLPKVRPSIKILFFFIDFSFHVSYL